MRIAKDAHDDTGHCSWDPTLQRVCDSYWWPNQHVFIATYCCSCHECQMRSTYHNTIPLQLQYVRTILRQFDTDSVHMLISSGGQKYIVDIIDNLTGPRPVHSISSKWLPSQTSCSTLCVNSGVSSSSLAIMALNSRGPLKS